MLLETLSEALQAAKNEAIAAKAVVSADFDFEPMQYNTTQRKSYPIDSLRGKPTRKYFHVIVSRLEGKYEVIAYAN